MGAIQFPRWFGMAAGVLVVGAAMPAKAELLVYEPFDYAAGVEMDGLAANGLNLSGSYATSTIQDLVVATPGLTYGNLLGGVPAVAGNRLSDLEGVGSGAVTAGFDDDVLIPAGQTLYFSALFTLDDSENGNHLAAIVLVNEANGDEIGFGEAAVGVGGTRVWADTVATNGLRASGRDGAFSNGQTLWMIGRYINSAAAGGDTLDLVGYDVAASHSIPATFDPTDPNAQFSYTLDDWDIDLTQLSAVQFVIRGEANNFIDELRIGSTYASVAVPEPSTAVFVTTGMLLLGVGARRRVW